MKKNIMTGAAIFVAFCISALLFCRAFQTKDEPELLIKSEYMLHNPVEKPGDEGSILQLPLLDDHNRTSEDEPTPKSGNTQNQAGLMGQLIISGKPIDILASIEEASLKKAPGWMPESALPGEDGMCVILGHRNRKHLRTLEHVKVGDSIVFIYPDGRRTKYLVEDTRIYENSADWRFPAMDGSTMVLVTCWPFRYSRNAPGKFMVSGRLTMR